MATTVGSGLGGFAAIAPQPTYGSTFVTPTRTLTMKSVKMTYNPHIVQGGPYLAGGRLVDIGSAHVQTWLDATGTIMGDVTDVGHALLLASALGTSAQLTALGTTTAYSLGGTNGAVLGAPEQAGSTGGVFDMQLGVPTVNDGVQHPENYHSTMVTKAEWVFDRAGLVTYSYDVDAQYVEKTTALITPSYAAAPIPFSMSGTSCAFKVGTFGSETQTDGIRKATITLDRKLSTDRMYLGNTYKDEPVTNERVDVTVALEVDYTTAAKTGLFDIFLAGTAISVVCSSIGSQIASTGYFRTFQLNVTNAFVQTGGESPLDGPDLVKNTITLKGTIDASSDPAIKALFYTADTSF
jgi:hypothetical protein